MSESTRDAIVRMHLSGMTNGQIKLATGLSRGTIGGHLDRWRKEERVKNPVRHQMRPYAPSMIQRSNPTFNRDLETEIRQREADHRFVVALAKAFQRGDHLPKGAVPELRLIG